MFDFSTLITDRSPADLELLRDLLSTPMGEWTAEQLAAFNQAASKGAYNYTDLNRVTACMEYLDGTLRGYGYRTGYQRIIVPHIGGGGSALPEGYTELEYIQSTGTQYIDTGFKPNQDTRVAMNVSGVSASSGTAALFGGRTANGSSSFAIWALSGVIRSDYGSNLLQTNQPYATVQSIDKNKNVIVLNEIENTQPYSTFQAGASLTIFTINDAASGVDNRMVSMRLYSCQVYDNGTLIRNFVPCQDPTGNVGLYDLVGAQFYGNAGSGAFTAGPEVPAPEPEPTLDPYTWYEVDIPTASQMAQYLSNVLSIWDTIMGDPTLPETMANLTQEEANQIEAALIEINTAIEQIVAGMARSNSFTFWSGHRPFPTAYSNRGRNWAELDAMGTSWRNWQVATWYLLLYGNLDAEGDVT